MGDPVATIASDGREGRIRAIDATRGFALLFVFLSHFGDAYFEGLGLWDAPTHMLLIRITMFASPAFMVISGTMLGYLLGTGAPERRERIGMKLQDRGLFLLLIAHPLLVLAYVPMVGERAPLLFQITDAIGCSLLMGPAVMARVTAGLRVALGLFLIAVTWFVLACWDPSGSWIIRATGHVLFGDLHEAVLLYSFPLVPWFGLYLLGSAFGERLARLPAEARVTAMQALAVRLGAGLVGLGVALSIAYRSLKVTPGAPTLSDGLLLHLLSPLQKSPPGPAYLSLYGGAGLLALGLMPRLPGTRPGARVFAVLGAIGRTSLIGFLIQYFVYYAGVRLLPTPPVPWPLYFLATVALMVFVQSAWDARDLNRSLSLRTPELRLWWRARRQSAVSGAGRT